MVLMQPSPVVMAPPPVTPVVMAPYLATIPA